MWPSGYDDDSIASAKSITYQAAHRFYEERIVLIKLNDMCGTVAVIPGCAGQLMRYQAMKYWAHTRFLGQPSLFSENRLLRHGSAGLTPACSGHMG
jgi:hypothetical protein